MGLRKEVDRLAGKRPLDDHMGLLAVLLKRRSRGQTISERAIARMLACTGGYKVSHAGQSQTRHSRAAARFDKAAHLGKTARHDQSGGVVPQSDAVRGAYGDGDDVLEGGAYLGAHNIVAYIRAKVSVAKSRWKNSAVSRWEDAMTVPEAMPLMTSSA